MEQSVKYPSIYLMKVAARINLDKKISHNIIGLKLSVRCRTRLGLYFYYWDLGSEKISEFMAEMLFAKFK